MLAVVEQDETAAIGEKCVEAVLGAAGTRRQTESAEDRRGDERRLRLRRQIDEEHAAGERVEDLRGDIEGGSCLAAAADACDRQQSLGRDELAQGGAFLRT